MNKTTKDELSSNGILRAAINMSNFLLVTDKTKDGTPIGVSPDMAQELADKLNLQLKLIPYTTPGEIADDAENDKWDICNIGAEPQRAEKINFSAAYAEIQATYIVQSNSKINNILDVDKIGNKICVASRTAYGLWLERNIQNAELIQVEGVDSSFDVFLNGNLNALAGLRPALIDDVKKISGAKILEGQFMSVQQAIGTSIQNIHSAIYIAEFVEEMKRSGFVEKLIDKHNVNGRLSVAKLA
jgi:polar amino acid transport system substrate-binding protein